VYYTYQRKKYRAEQEKSLRSRGAEFIVHRPDSSGGIHKIRRKTQKHHDEAETNIKEESLRSRDAEFIVHRPDSSGGIHKIRRKTQKHHDEAETNTEEKTLRSRDFSCFLCIFCYNIRV